MKQEEEEKGWCRNVRSKCFYGGLPVELAMPSKFRVHGLSFYHGNRNTRNSKGTLFALIASDEQNQIRAAEVWQINPLNGGRFHSLPYASIWLLIAARSRHFFSSRIELGGGLQCDAWA